MTTPTGFIQASDINVELGRAWNAPFNLNNPEVRNLAGKPSGAISFGDLRGKSNLIREPASGDYFQQDVTMWFDRPGNNTTRLYWNGHLGDHPIGSTAIVVGSWTYYRGSWRSDYGMSKRYGIYRLGRY